MKTIVIDCNVFVSAFIGSKTCYKVLEKAFCDYKVCFSEATLQELSETLKRPKFKGLLKTARVKITFELLHSLGIFLAPAPNGVMLPDPDDAIYLDLAVSAGAEYIITGNKKHFPEELCQGIKVISPSEFLQSASDSL